MLIDTNAWLGTWPFRSLRDNAPRTLIARMDRSGIDKAAVSYIEAAFHRHPQSANERLARDLEPHGHRLIPLGTLNPLSPHWERDLTACIALGMKGIRLFPQYHNYPTDGSEIRNAVRACAECGLPVFIPHRLEDARQHHWMDPGHSLDLAHLADLIAAVPDAAIVISNARPLARSPLWMREDLRDSNWYVDLSLAEIHYGLHRNTNAMKDLAYLIEEGGANHLLFGTHLPISYAGPALVKLALLPVDDKTRENIAHRTATNLLTLTRG